MQLSLFSRYVLIEGNFAQETNRNQPDYICSVVDTLGGGIVSEIYRNYEEGLRALKYFEKSN
jgi:hypothetical protein